ncbi:MAG: ATP-binding protein [Gammaproteobacteria bacterium]
MVNPPFGPRLSPRDADSPARTWRPLRFLNLYRFTLAALFAILYHLNELPTPLGLAAPELFYHTSLAYLSFSLLAFYPVSLQRPPFLVQLYVHILADIAFITLLMHASGGVSSGVGMLLVVSIANGSMIAAGRLPGFFAAIATIAILLEQAYNALFPATVGSVNYSLAGLLGIALFATAILAHVLARRARESEALAQQRSIDLANMAQLTDYIIQQMQTGVMVVDPENRVRLMNSAAWQQLGAPLTKLLAPLSQFSRELDQLVKQWMQEPDWKKHRLQVEGTSRDLLVQLLSIGHERRDGTLIFLEDAATTTRQAQQLKLASLGRLTASIAHEVRNPLGAISHAAALLGEAPELSPADQRLTEIITTQSQRINAIVENVLQLGRRDRSRAELLPLQPWLEKFLQELAHSDPTALKAVKIRAVEAGLEAHFDPNQLQQILLNLCLNGLRHAAASKEAVKVMLHAGSLDAEHGYLDIIDSGPGVAAAQREQIFEPFFTTESSGTGLGLYLARELAESNRAQLRYEPTRDGRSRFRLVFQRHSSDDMEHHD